MFSPAPRAGLWAAGRKHEGTPRCEQESELRFRFPNKQSSLSKLRVLGFTTITTTYFQTLDLKVYLSHVLKHGILVAKEEAAPGTARPWWSSEVGSQARFAQGDLVSLWVEGLMRSEVRATAHRKQLLGLRSPLQSSLHSLLSTEVPETRVP